jgi:RHS repeat-associated protein
MNSKNKSLFWVKSFGGKLAAGVALLFIAATVTAAPAITSDNAKPHFATLQNQEQFTDMRVKVLGGDVRITRRWEGTRWVWNSRWQGLSVDKDTTMFQEELEWLRRADLAIRSPSERNLVSPPPVLYRAGQLYRRSALHDDGASYEHQLNQFIRLHPNGYTWTDTNGNGIEYDLYGMIIGYYDRNNIHVHISRDNHGYIHEIKDHHENVVLTYDWEPIPGVDPRMHISGEELIPRRLAKISDYTGRETVYNWNDKNQLTEIIDVRGSTWTLAYNDKGELTQIRDPNDRATHYEINSAGRLYSRINSDGVGVNYELAYDEDKDEYYLSETHTSGEVKETWYNGMGNVIRSSESGDEKESVEIILSDNSIGPENILRRYRTGERRWYRGETLVRIDEHVFYLPPSEPVYVKCRITTDSQGNKTTREFDRWKNEVSITYPDDSRVVRKWDGPNSLLLEETNELGITTKYEYDDAGRRITEIRAYGTEDEQFTRYTYDQYGQLESLTRGESQGELAITRFEHDQYGNITQRTDPLGGVTTWSDHDALGNARFRTDPNTNAANSDYRWEVLYDPAGNLLANYNPYGQGVRYGYDLTGHLATIKDEQGNETTLTSNARGLLTEVLDAEGHVSAIEYDNAYRPTAMTDANEHTTQTRYDVRGRVAKKIDGEGNEVSYIYDERGLAEVRYPSYSEGYSYDSHGRPTQTLQQANDRSYIRGQSYDAMGNRISSSDAMGNSEYFEYDGLDRLSTVTDAEGGVTQFRYDYLDNITYVSDPEGRVTQYEHDLKGRIIAEFKGEGANKVRKLTYEYDANDNLIAVSNAAEEKTTYEYDAANRVVAKRVFSHRDAAHPVKVVHYHYNLGRQLAGYSQELGTDDQGQPVSDLTEDVTALSKTYTYTQRGQIESVTFDFGPFTKTYSYTYYPNGLRKTYTNPEGITYTYYYNKNNLLTAVHIPGSGQMNFTDFFWLRPQTLLLPGGGKITLSYDDFLQVKERILEDPANTSVAEAIYQYDLEGNIQSITASEGAYRFGYDSNYRLTSVQYPELLAANDEEFGYDGVGNRTHHSVTLDSGTEEPDTQQLSLVYNDQNQLIQKGDITFTYNANGHADTKTENDRVTEYIYNHEERLIAVKVDGHTVGRYAYNPEGHRIKKAVNGVTTYFLYNEEGLAAEYNAHGNLIKEYHFKPYETWMTDPLFQRTADGQVYYYQNDHLGTPQRMVRSNGAVVWQAYYSAFGEAEVVIEIVQNNLRFPGQYFDEETGLNYNYFRDYDPTNGRYLQSDPIGLKGGINTYVYVKSNPMSLIDPKGLWGINPFEVSPREQNSIKVQSESQRINRSVERKARREIANRINENTALCSVVCSVESYVLGTPYTVGADQAANRMISNVDYRTAVKYTIKKIVAISTIYDVGSCVLTCKDQNGCEASTSIDVSSM